MDPTVGKELKTKVLPHLQASYLPVTLMEREFGDLVYIAQPTEDDFIPLAAPSGSMLVFYRVIFVFLYRF